MAEMSEAEAWIENDSIIIVVRDKKGGYYEATIDISELEYSGFDYTPEGA